MALLTVEGTLTLDAKGSLPGSMSGRTVRANTFGIILFVVEIAVTAPTAVCCDVVPRVAR